MKIRVKIGTHPAEYMHVYRAKPVPYIGQPVKLKESNKPSVDVEPVVINDIQIISGEVLFFAERM